MTDTFTASLPIRNDPWYILCSKACDDSRYERVRDEIIAGNKELEQGYQHYNMDGGPFFHDTRSQSIITAPATTVTGATTDKLIHPASLIALPTGYFIAGKKLRMNLWFTVTSGAATGNLQIASYVGTTDAGGTAVLPTSAAITGVNAQTNISFWCTAYLKCNGGAVETAKPVECYMQWLCGIAYITAANQQGANPLPISAPAAVNIDNTSSTLGWNIQFRNSGANANTYTTRDLTFEALT